jgi:hypothetical protein
MPPSLQPCGLPLPPKRGRCPRNAPACNPSRRASRGGSAGFAPQNRQGNSARDWRGREARPNGTAAPQSPVFRASEKCAQIFLLYLFRHLRVECFFIKKEMCAVCLKKNC